MPKKVLIINSDPRFVKGLHSKLKDSNLEGLAAYDGVQAIKTAIEGKPDLIILDADIKGGGGINVLENLRTSSLTALIPVIFMADSNMKDMEEKVLGMGVEAFIVKPFDLEDLFDKIRNIFGKAQAEPQAGKKNSAGEKDILGIYNRLKKEMRVKGGTKQRILIIDDEKDVVELVSFRLNAAGYETIKAYDGTEGLKMAKEQEPDLIVLDLMLPKLDGYKVCRMLKFDENYRDIPIIMFTSRVGETDKVTGREVGADAYITKPFEPKVLLSKIEELLKK